jgi:hypothetical protein
MVRRPGDVGKLSDARLQGFEQRVGQLPPQSTPVSLPFCTASVQLGAAQKALMQTPLWQSASFVHVESAGHALQSGPPQSMSVSTPFFTISVHVAVAHRPLVHTPLAH